MSRHGRDENPDEIVSGVGHFDNRRSAKQPLSPDISNARRHSPGGDVSQEHSPISRPREKEHEDFYQRRTRHLDPDRSRDYTLRDSELRTLSDIGTFRTLKRDDVITHRYGGDSTLARRDLDHLSRQKLIEQRTSYPEKTVYITLTKAAHRFLQDHKPDGSSKNQALYHGFVKPREARHDAAIYRLYQQESERIERSGGHVKRVILDFELKRSVNSKLAKLQSLSPAEQAEGKRRIAVEHSLPVVNGKIALPDLRLEYEGPNHEAGRVDLELITGDYHTKGLRAKAQTGFTMYGLPEDAARLRPAMSDPEIMLNILSL